VNHMTKLLDQWENNASKNEPVTEIAIHLSLREAARIHALKELYPGCTEEDIVADLVREGLNQIEIALPYIQGKKVIAEDEFGDLIYEDIGKTPRFERLTDKFTAALKVQLQK